MLFTLSAVLVSLLSVKAQNSNPSAGLGIAIDNSKSFCLIIPPNAGDNIADKEPDGIAACLGNPAGALPTKPMPDGLIQSAHYLKTDDYVQVTGKINPSAYKLNPNDDGGQWDDASWGILPKSGCVGYGAYLEYFSANQYCVRCCKDPKSESCNASYDTRGCQAGIPGDYGEGFSDNGSASPAPSVNPVPPTTSSIPNTPSYVPSNPGPGKQEAESSSASAQSTSTRSVSVTKSTGSASTPTPSESSGADTNAVSSSQHLIFGSFVGLLGAMIL